MQMNQQVSNAVSARALEPAIREEIELLRVGEASKEQRAEVRQLEAIAARVHELDKLGESILAAVASTLTPVTTVTSEILQLRGSVDNPKDPVVTKMPSKLRNRRAGNSTKKIAQG